MYLLPQEIEVWYIIPAIRREMSKVFVKKYDMTLEKAGSLLGITKAAVSQYLNKKRAGKVKLPEDIRREIENSAGIIVEDEKRAVGEIMRILKLMKEKGCSCGVCRKFNKGIISKCGCDTRGEL